MDTVLKHFQTKYNFSNYQIAQLRFLFITLASEISKILIMGILFYNKFPLYLFALFVMLCLRSTTGGLHFYTYKSCLFASAVFLWLAIHILPSISIPVFLSLIILLMCIITCYTIGPITSKYRPAPSQNKSQKYRSLTCGFIFIYSVIFYIFSDHILLITGFWVIVLHSLQLVLAKLKRKEN